MDTIATDAPASSTEEWSQARKVLSFAKNTFGSILMAAWRFFMRDPIVILLGPGSNGGCFIPKTLEKKPCSVLLAADELFAPAAYDIKQ